MRLVKELKPSDFPLRIEFGNWVLGHPEIIESDFFFMSDESNFYLDGHVNRHNFVYWNDHCPENHFTESSLNIQKIEVWAALSATQLFGPYFYSDTINQSKYREILTKFVNDLENVFGFEICNSVWFQQDGASSHTAADTIRYVTSLFGNRTIGKNLAINWPPRSPDLSTLDFFSGVT